MLRDQTLQHDMSTAKGKMIKTDDNFRKRPIKYSNQHFNQRIAYKSIMENYFREGE